MPVRPNALGLLPPFLLAAILLQTTPARAGEFPSVPADLLAESGPRVTPDADAEVVWWDIVTNITANTQLAYANVEHRLRIKVYTARGAEQAGSFALPATDRLLIRYVQGRTTQPDGKALALNPADVHEQDFVRVGRLRGRVVRFALPGVQPGSVLDVSWIESHAFSGLPWLRLELARDLPVRRLHVQVHPYVGASTMAFHAEVSNAGVQLTEHESKRELDLENVPAIVREPFQPPDADVLPRLVVGYLPLSGGTTRGMWSARGQGLWESWNKLIRPTADVRAAARAAAAEATDPDEKMRRLIAWVRANITNTDELGTTSTADLARDRSRTPADVLRDRRASGEELNVLLASLAAAAGLPARLALAPDRSDGRFDPESGDYYRLKLSVVAVGQGEGVRIYDIHSSALPGGHPSWEQESIPIFAPEDTVPVFASVRAFTAAENLVRHRAELALTEEGDAEGRVQLEFRGQWAIARRIVHGDSLGARRAEIERDYQRSYPGSEVGDFSVGALHHPDSALVYTFHVRVPGYAEVAGDRLLMQPGFFARLQPGIFSAETRRWPVEFPFPASESDSVVWRLPAGREPESLQPPADVTFGPYGHSRFGLARSASDGSLTYSREFEMRATYFPVSAYASLKRSLDDLAVGERTTIVLRRAGSPR